MEKLLGPWFETVLTFVKAHPLLWFSLLILFVIVTVVNGLAKFLPQLDVLRSKILLPIAKRFRQKRLVKSAIKSDIRGHVNREIAKMRNYLPAGWVGEMDVEWVESEELEALIDDERIVVRIRPVDNQDRNFVNATYHYLRSSFFPKTQGVIPKPHYEASVLYVCHRVVEGRSRSAKEVFEDCVLEPMVQRHKNIPNHLDDYTQLDSRGFFTGTFLRELHLMAMNARFTRDRNKMTEETTQVVKHIKDFITAYDDSRVSMEQIPSRAWYNNGAVSRYALLLVAHPLKTQHGIDPYVNKARKGFNMGIKRLYVFGSNSEIRFANAVISGIDGAVDGIRLVEKFETPFDYRGSTKGVGAIFESVS
jgi:hypothetical protein